MSSPTLPIQQAIYGMLTSTSGFETPVYDEVPETAQPPYVVIGEAYETPEDAHDRLGTTTVVTIHVWSSQKGFSEAETIADQVSALLNHQPLDVDGWAHIATRRDFKQNLRDPDPKRRHVAIRFRVQTEETPA